MPLAQESIIAPGAVNARAPLKRSTVAWIGAGIMVLATIGVVAPLFVGGGQTPPPAPAPQKEPPPQAGTPQTIDSEFAEAQRRAAIERAEEARLRQKLEDEAQRTSSKQQATADSVAPMPNDAQSSPVPPEARRENSSSAFYAQGRGGQRPPQESQQEREFEIDATARTSKSLAFDHGGGMPGSMDSSPAEQTKHNLPSPAPVGYAGVDDRSRSTSALDALLRAQTSQPSSAPRSADRAWIKELAAETGSGSKAPLRPYGVSSPYVLLQGKVLPALLMRDINTDLPGELSACLTMDVYDSITSDHLLMPKGSCLVGQYSNSVRPGQDRVLFAFTRIILPNGLSFDLPGAPGSDPGGASGVEGSVNNHFFRMFTSSFLVAWLADRAERNAPTGTSIGTSGGAKTAAGQVLVDTSRSVLERDKLIAPTITVRKGERINVEVTRDMEFPGPYRK